MWLIEASPKGGYRYGEAKDVVQRNKHLLASGVQPEWLLVGIERTMEGAAERVRQMKRERKEHD